MKRISLNGIWNLTYTYFGKYLSETAIGEYKELKWLDAVVPGDVHLDLMKAGLIDDPFFGRNTDHCLWMESKDWWYRKSFVVPEDLSGKAIYLRFAGLDTFASVFLNKRLIGKHKNMFTPLEIDVTKYLKTKGENELLVKLTAPLYGVTPEIRGKAGAHDPLIVYTRKVAESYGWDIAPRLLTIGIWKDVELCAFDEVRITDLYIHTLEISRQNAVVGCEVEVQKEVGGSTELELEMQVGGQTKRINFKLTEKQHNIGFKFQIKDPRLWWPNGYGEQNLYRCQARLLRKGIAIDTRKSDFGIRKVELVQEPQKSGGTSFSFRINGKDIFIKGFNWSPPDAIFARTGTKRYEELLTLVKECNANMLRVCGVGTYEKEVFYQLCDRLGILIWQDFMLNGLIYPQEDQDFMENLKEEVEFVVKDLRNHPCIALWCGDNEGDLRWTNWDGSHHYFNRITRELIPGILQRLNPERVYLPSSPSSPNLESDPNDRLSGDRHQYMQGADYKHPDFMHNPCCPRFISETGYISCPDKEVLRQFLHQEEMWPTDNKVWWYHSADTLFVGWRHRIQALHDGLKNNGKPDPKNIDEFIQYTQEVQAEALVEWFNVAAQNPECGGILFWNLCDCWPQISDAVIAYPCKPKLAYKALCKAFGKIRR
ncbi:MAG: sugar-binding domain-containing protein [Candidatus Omnitrophota bacterium]